MEDCKTKKKILIEGMEYPKSKNSIKEALCKLMGVTRVNVDVNGEFAILDANIDIRDRAIRFAINKLGYKVKGIIPL